MRHLLLAAVSGLVLSACGAGEETSSPAPSTPAQTTEAASPSTPTPTAGFNQDRNAYFGDMHIHTRNSFDAYIFNVRKTPDDAYRFARGEAVEHPSGFDMTIAGGPLDFYAVTDHAAYLGILPAMDTPGTVLSELPQAKAMFGTDPEQILAAFQTVGGSVRSGEPIEEMYDLDVIKTAWQDTVDAADRHNEPGVFTTFSAYEYTSVTVNAAEEGFGGGNLHRNVFFRGEAPERPFSTLDSDNPERLWDWMDAQRAEGVESLSIPHNSNVSDGNMFRLETYEGNALSAAYAEQRRRNEPLVEVTQVKGTSETHPDLSPNDEWSGFEIYDKLLGSSTLVSETKGSYVREAYKNGLKLQEGEGFDPFKFGLVGASDSHVVGGAYDEEDYWSKVGIVDGTPIARGSVPIPGTDWSNQPLETNNDLLRNNVFSRWGASGLTGVWAEENTRAAIFDALRRKETFATTGPRIKVRFFAGFNYADDLVDDPALVSTAYRDGVPMGGDLVGAGEAPDFIVWAQRDANSAPLQRVQVVKVTARGEAVYDAACHSGAPDAATHRCADNGASVDRETCAPTGGGAAELKTMWQDPDFNPGERATYYVRVLENPTCRWSTWEALRAGTPPRPDVDPILQERAYTSPIWYLPGRVTEE